MPEAGQEAPDFTLPDQDGKPLTLSELRGQTVVLYFYPKADTRIRNYSNAKKSGHWHHPGL